MIKAGAGVENSDKDGLTGEEPNVALWGRVGFTTENRYGFLDEGHTYGFIAVGALLLRKNMV